LEERGFKLGAVIVVEAGVPKPPWPVLLETLADGLELDPHVGHAPCQPSSNPG
jgi:hypothetical protein